ncbi:MAG: ABC transporter permease [Marinisporobacter sp.]|jgi:ribose transport system permease protein|nr:ABC transporter permease [Marinisporobacter sp.]
MNKTKNLDVKELLFKIGPLLALILLSLVLSFATDDFLQVNNLMNVLRQASINSLIAVGMLVIIITAGIDLSVGPQTALSICVMGLAMKAGVTSTPILIVIGLATGTLTGLINGLLLTRLNLPHPFIATIGSRNIYRGIALIVTGAAPIMGFPKGIQFLGGGTTFGIPNSFIIVIIVYTAMHIFLNRTELGRKIYSVGGNEEAARLSGINVKNVLTFVYTLCGFMCAFAGIVLVGRVNAAFPLAGQKFDMDAIAAVIIGGASFFGGKGTVWGTLIGALLITVIRNGLNLLSASADVQLVAIGLVIILAVFIDVLRTRMEEKARRLAQAE